MFTVEKFKSNKM